MREAYTCPLELTHDITRGKWKPMILWQLGKGGRSLSALRGEIGGIGEKMLIQHLRELEEFGMVHRRQFPGYPLRVEYTLTARGHNMLAAVEIMQGIGVDLMLEAGMEDTLRSAGLLPGEA